MNISKITIFFILMIVSQILVSQDLHFSQFYNNQITLNPAVSSILNSNCRMQILYRSQWASISGFTPFTTLHASAEYQTNILNGTLGGGVQFFQDNSGKIGLNTSRVALNGAYSMQLSEGLFLGAGVSFGFNQRSNGINSRTTHPSQYDPTTGEFNPDLPVASGSIKRTTQFSQIGIGIVGSYEKRNQKVVAGLGFLNLNSPNESFYTDIIQEIPLSTTFFGIYQNEFSNTALSKTSLIYHSIGSASEFVAMQQFFFYGINPLGKYQYTSVGLGSRFSDALILSIGSSFSNIHLEISYDITISEVRNTNNGSGGIELSVNYSCGFIPNFQYRTIPCKRY